MARRVIIDANVTLGLFLKLPYSQKVDQCMQVWHAEQAHLAVPALWEYECITGFRRAVILKIISEEQAESMVDGLFSLEFQRIAPTLELHRAAWLWARRIGQSKVYGAQYLALAENLSAEFWTADQRLFHSLQGLGINWAHSVFG